jgi:hypothetical protein
MHCFSYSLSVLVERHVYRRCTVLKIVETTIDAQSNAKLTRPNRFPKLRQAFATIFSEELRVPEIALLSDTAFTQDWHLSEEDVAWTNLQPE